MKTFQNLLYAILAIIFISKVAFAMQEDKPHLYVKNLTNRTFNIKFNTGRGDLVISVVPDELKGIERLEEIRSISLVGNLATQSLNKLVNEEKASATSYLTEDLVLQVTSGYLKWNVKPVWMNVRGRKIEEAERRAKKLGEFEIKEDYNQPEEALYDVPGEDEGWGELSQLSEPTPEQKAKIDRLKELLRKSK